MVVEDEILTVVDEAKAMASRASSPSGACWVGWCSWCGFREGKPAALSAGGKPMTARLAGTVTDPASDPDEDLTAIPLDV